MRLHVSLALLGTSSSLVAAFPSPIKQSSKAVAAVGSPQVGTISMMANLTDPDVTRDSCISTRMGSRVFWTCRDTENYNATTGKASLPVLSNSASWTKFDTDGRPAITQHNNRFGAGSTGHNPILHMSGGDLASKSAFYPIPSNACGPNGFCQDGTRWAIWPDSAPLVTSKPKNATRGTYTAYTWIPKVHLRVLTGLNAPPPTIMYRVTYTETGAASPAMPKVEMVKENFWKKDQVGYGVYGGLVSDGYAYLYGGTLTNGVALAKVPVGAIEDKSRYRYYVNGAWTANIPNPNSTAANVPNAGTGGQGGFYYSGYLKSFVWVGGSQIGGSADFYVSTAPRPEGPWTKATFFYKGPVGNSQLVSAYSCVPSPALLESEDQNGIYLTWTQAFEGNTYGAYVTPLVYVTWK